MTIPFTAILLTSVIATQFILLFAGRLLIQSTLAKIMEGNQSVDKTGIIFSCIIYIPFWVILFLPISEEGISNPVSTSFIVSFSISTCAYLIYIGIKLARQMRRKADRSASEMEEIRKTQIQAVISNTAILLLLSLIVYVGIAAFLLYLIPDTTVVASEKNGYSHKLAYGWPQGRHPRLFSSYHDNQTNDTLYLANISYAMIGNDNSNLYSINGAYPPKSFEKIIQRPNYVMRPIPGIMRPCHNKSGYFNRRTLFLVNNKILRSFTEEDMGKYGLLDNREVKHIKLPSNSLKADTSHMYDYDISVRLQNWNEYKTAIKKGLPTNVAPEFPGGNDSIQEYLRRNLRYPGICKEAGIEGTSIIRFTILPEGSLTDIEVAKSADPFLDEEALRLIREMPDWTPGIINGKRVGMHMRIPVEFKLPTNAIQ